MADKDLSQLTTSGLTSGVGELSISPYSPDRDEGTGEIVWLNEKWGNQVGYFKGVDVVPEFHRAVTALSTWTAGKGITTDIRTEVILENINGGGNESFDEIMMNMINMKKVTGDSYAEIIRSDDGRLLNLKVLSGDRVRVIWKKGIIDRYEQISLDKKGTVTKFKPHEILHLMNDRVADEIHGTSLADIVSWIVTAKKEAMGDWRRISHRSTIRVLYVDADNTSKLNTIKEQYKEGIKNGEILIIPSKRGDAEFQDLTLPPVEAFLSWLRYLDSLFYQVVGVPRVIATSEGFTESGGKVGFLTFEPTYTKEQTLLEQDLWGQLAIRVKFNRPPSLGGDLARDEAKDPQAIQPNDTQAGVGQ